MSCLKLCALFGQVCGSVKQHVVLNKQNAECSDVYWATLYTAANTEQNSSAYRDCLRGPFDRFDERIPQYHQASQS